MGEGRFELSVRWTVGDVSPWGFEALRLSIWGAYRLFGPRSRYAVCVNTVGISRARSMTGAVPSVVEWRRVTRDDLFAPIARRLDTGMAEGVGWKFAPLRVDAERPELALDNDCVLWGMPAAIAAWLAAPDAACVLAQDVRACFGRFADLCGDAPRNSGIRGVGVGFPLGAVLSATLAEKEGTLTSELDEQGLQVAALTRAAEVKMVTVEEVSICSPFPPHAPRLGRAGAHFVGLNARELPWSWQGRPAHEVTREHWRRLRHEVYSRVGITPDDAHRVSLTETEPRRDVTG